MTRVALFGDPTKALGTVAVARVRARRRRHRPGRGAAACRSSGSRCPPAPRSRWTAAPRTWTGWPRALRRIITFTQAGGEINIVVAGINVGAQPYWNAEATMLHAHQGHPGHDAGQRDGADRQAVAGLLRRRLGRGQLRHRRLRPGDGPERAGAVLGAEPHRRRATILFAHYDHAYVAPGRAVPAAGRHRRPARPRRARRSRTSTRPARSPRSARSSPRRPTRTARSRSTSAR